MRLRIAVAVAAFLLLPVVPASAGTWHQSYGRAESDTCEEGWSPSWAWWPNNGTGGFVCNRDVDDPSTGAAPPQRSQPPSLSGRWFTYAGGLQLTPRDTVTISSPFNLCTWSQARLAYVTLLVTLDSWVDSTSVTVTNSGPFMAETTVEVQCD